MKLKKEKGFFIIEALMAIFVFLAGVLGVLAVQTDSIQATSDAQYRLQASFMAENIIGQMMLDKNNIDGYASTGGTGGTNYSEWKSQLTTMLPGIADNPPEITVTTVSGSKVVTVIINWKKPLDTGVSTFETQTTIF